MDAIYVEAALLVAWRLYLLPQGELPIVNPGAWYNSSVLEAYLFHWQWALLSSPCWGQVVSDL